MYFDTFNLSSVDKPLGYFQSFAITNNGATNTFCPIGYISKNGSKSMQTYAVINIAKLHGSGMAGQRLPNGHGSGQEIHICFLRDCPQCYQTFSSFLI